MVYDKNFGNCDCLVGEAYFDSAGNCRCTDSTTQLPTQGFKKKSLSDYSYPAPTYNPTNDSMNSIFGVKPPRNKCSGLQAPNGYQYIVNAQGACVLVVKYDYDETRFVGSNTGVVSGSNTVAGITDKAQIFYQDNKALVLVGLAAAAYFAFGAKGRPMKQRDTTTSTKY